MIEKFRSRVFNVILYPDDPTQVSAIDLLKNQYDCAYILHDKDFNDDGEIKKAHYHFVIKFPSAKWSTSLANELNILPNYIQDCKNFRNSLTYLIHFNNPEKYQYDLDEVYGSLKSHLSDIIKQNVKCESQSVLELINFIYNSSGIIHFREFAEYCAVNGYWAVYRRSSLIFTKMIDEHNKNIS